MAFCSLPWLHLATHPHGGLTLCCQSEMEKGLSAASNRDGKDPMTLNERPLTEMINSSTFREVRLSMLRGERHPACAPCWDREDHGVQSKRQYDNKRFPLTLTEARALTAKDGSITPNIQFAELRLGNVCNIKCVTCNPNSSVQFGREYEQIQKKPGMEFLRDYSWVTPGMADWTEDVEFWDDLSVNSPDLREVYINGGEPMLIRRHEDFLRSLITSGRAKNVRLTYSINMTKLIETLRPVWKEFRDVHFACSVDDWDQRNFYIRYPSPWAKVTENFGKLREWGFSPHVLQTVSVLNFFYLDDFYRRWQALYPESVISYNDVVDPPWFSPLVLAPRLRREILQRLKATLPMNLYQQLEHLYGGDQHLAQHWGALRKQLRAFDEARELRIQEYFPELEALLNESQESLV